MNAVLATASTASAPATARIDLSALPPLWPDGIEPSRLIQSDLDTILLWATDAGASDIVLVSDEPPVVRLDGEFTRISKRGLSTPELAELVNDIRGAANASAQLIGGEALDFSYQIQRTRDSRLRYRVNATSGQTQFTSTGISIVFRAIPEAPPSISDLGLEDDLVAIHRDVALSQGLFLVVGATGTGKTTLIASLMADVLQTHPGRHVLTYEAPVEFDLSAVEDRVGIVVQSEIPRHIRTFAEGVSNALRRAPNVILVGESRDPETVRATVMASMTGHAVYTTVHAGSVAAAIPRIVSEFAEVDQPAIHAQILGEIRGVVTQRLLPKAGGGRVAVREYLRFTQDIRMRLATIPRVDFQPEVHRLVAERGQSLLEDARRKRAEGLIDAATLQVIEAEWAADGADVTGGAA